MTGTTLLLRQIHPTQVHNGFASSYNFRPTDTDAGLMSVYDGDMISAENAWKHRTNTLGKQSIGVVGLLVEECTAEGLSARPDPEPFPEHAVVDFNAVEQKAWRAKSKKLHAKAYVRGWLFQSPPTI